MSPDVASIAAWTGLAAVVFTPLATIVAARWQNRTAVDVARRQIAASVVSASRQRWIDELRSSLSEFQAAIGELLYKRTLDIESRWQDDPRWEKASELRFRIALLINPKEADHVTLLGLVDKRINMLRLKPSQDWLREAQVVGAELTAVAQTVLKREWERVKQGENGGVLPAAISRQDA